jgi:hypothetical protein
MNTLIDKSETGSTLDLGTLSTTLIQHDAASPPGRVVVNAGSVNVGDCAHLTLEGATLVTNSINERIDSTIIVDNGSVLDVKGAVPASSTQRTDIGNNSTVDLGNAAGFSLLSGMSFIGSHATLKLGGSSPLAPVQV